MNCEKCGCEIKGDDVFYLIEVTKKYASNTDVGYPELEMEVCEGCGESAMFSIR